MKVKQEKKRNFATFKEHPINNHINARKKNRFVTATKLGTTKKNVCCCKQKFCHSNHERMGGPTLMQQPNVFLIEPKILLL